MHIFLKTDNNLWDPLPGVNKNGCCQEIAVTKAWQK
jgi:hypothetical protein